VLSPIVFVSSAALGLFGRVMRTDFVLAGSAGRTHAAPTFMSDALKWVRA
jgi:hypothetical protein